MIKFHASILLDNLFCSVMQAVIHSILVHVQSAFTNVNFHKVLHTSAVAAETYEGSLVYPEITAFLSWISVAACLLVLLLSWDPGLCIAGNYFGKQ